MLFANAAHLNPATVMTFQEPEQEVWLLSRRADFWFACGGASVGLLAAILLIFFHGDRELDTLDLVLSEFHLGATYDAILRRRLWRRRPGDVVLIPLVILVLSYALSMNGQTVLLTSIAMYAAVWHRGRQSYGVARFYQRGMGGSLSRARDVLFRGAIYLPMWAAMLAYTQLAPKSYEGEAYLALSVGADMTSALGVAAAFSVVAYLVSTCRPARGHLKPKADTPVHPGERWVVLAHAVAFGSSYVFGASNASFLFVIAVHHEVQYLCFTYAMARRSAACQMGSQRADSSTGDLSTQASRDADRARCSKVKFNAGFFLWPVIGFAGALAGGWLAIPWLAPLGMGGLFCHYWLDGRIWTRRALQQ
jgi:hypothetical protein